MPFIFTGKQNDVAYCSLNSFGEFVLTMADWLIKTTVSPATKEQRDLLFQKMKAAGYELDSDKKKLVKLDGSDSSNDLPNQSNGVCHLANEGSGEDKKVDLEKEMHAFATLELEPLKIYDADAGISITMHQLYRCAEHFFKVGMYANNPVTAADRGIADEIIFALNALGKEKMICYDKEIEWIRNKVKKG
jgi:hypothetical protein